MITIDTLDEYIALAVLCLAVCGLVVLIVRHVVAAVIHQVYSPNTRRLDRQIEPALY